MFWAWKDTILSHYSLLSGKGLKNRIHRLADKLRISTLSLFLASCNLAEGPSLRNLGPLNARCLGLLSSGSGFAKRPSKSAYLACILRVRIIGSAYLVCQTNRQAMGRYRLAHLPMKC